MASRTFILWLLFGSHFRGISTYTDAGNTTCKTVSLVHVYPSSSNEELSEWDATELNLLRLAGRLALKHINNNSGLLPGLKLNIIDVSTDDCINAAPLQNMVEVFQHVSEGNCVFGVVGLYCSKATQVIATHLSHPNLGYIQLSSSTSPLLQNSKRYPYLFRVISPSILFNRAIISMMDEFMWKNISLVYDFSNIFFRTTGFDFATQAQRRTDLNILGFFPIRSSGNHYILENVVKKESRIAYFSITHNETSDVLCDAYHHGFGWPEYVYIFVDSSLQEMLANNRTCTMDNLQQAAEGVILLLNRLTNSNNANKSGIYYDQYSKELVSEVGPNYGTAGMQYYSNVLYDQIWAFAFALNNSLSKLNLGNHSSVRANIKQSSHIRNILSEELRNISFEGASGRIEFDEQQEVLTMIDIYQVKNGEQVRIGEYNPFQNKLNLINFNKETVPKDSFEVRNDAIPLWLGVLVALCQGIVLLLFGITCVYVVHWRKAPEVKSTSLRVSILILIGCSMVMLSSLFHNLENFANVSATAITVFCNFESWLFLYGINIILVALLFRLLRVFIIFHYPQSTVELLADTHLVIYIVLTSLLPLIILVCWTAVDHLHQLPMTKFVFSSGDPHYTEHYQCYSNYIGIWIGVYYSWIGIMLLILLTLAILTRHIKYNNFKDTKKMGAYVFLMSFILGSLLPMSYLLETDEPVASYLLKSLITFLIPLACLAFQYFPKLFPVLQQRKLSHMSSSTSFKTSTLRKLSVIPK